MVANNNTNRKSNKQTKLN